MSGAKKQVSNTIPFDIDMVYLWVDGNDPTHKQKRLQLADKLGIVKKANDIQNDANNDCRYYNNDELKYSLRSLETYANWIRNIYIVTDNQVPAWLNTNNPRVHIIDHKEIIPNDALPTFNSNAIEHCIVNIPNLSEHFLYGNDDMFFWKNIQLSDFFDLPTRKVKVYTLGAIGDADNLFRKAMHNARKLLLKKFGKNFPNEMHHNIDAYLKSSMLACKEDFRDAINICIHNHFRADNDVCRTIYTGYACATGSGISKIVKRTYGSWWMCIINFIIQRFSKFSKYYDIDEIYDTHYLPKRLKKYHCKLFCVNDTEEATNENRKIVHQTLEMIFPNKSSFEK